MDVNLSSEHHARQAALHLAAINEDPEQALAGVRAQMAQAHATLALALMARGGRLG